MSELSSAAVSIAYCTDVEGNYDYWQRYVTLSKALSLGTNGRLILADGYLFVYGGDVCDRGAGDLRLLGDLNALNEDYPGRVFFIHGNRDVNKMRIPIEVHPAHLAKPGDVYWIPAKSEAGESAVDRLKYILAKTMGSPGGFDYRKAELAILGKPNADEDVVQSYLDQVDGPYSPLMKYLQRAVIAVNFGEVLFCHGGLNANNFGWLPPRHPNANPEDVPSDLKLTPGSAGGEMCDDVHAWIQESNRRAREEIDDFLTRGKAYTDSLRTNFSPHWGTVGSYDHDQPGSRLGYLGMAQIAGPDKKTNPSIIYSSFINAGMPADIEESVAIKLQNAGINRIVVGHQPHGDAPTLIQQHGLQVFMGDTSYSAGTLWDYGSTGTWSRREAADLANPDLELTGLPIEKDNTRGVAVSEIIVVIPDGNVQYGAKSNVFIHGILSDGSTYDFQQTDIETNRYVGKTDASKSWTVKASNVSVKNGPLKGRNDVFLLSRGEGFAFKNKYVLPENMESEMMK